MVKPATPDGDWDYAAAMARIKKATLAVDGEGRAAVFTVDTEFDWDRGDDDFQWEVVIRFRGADTGLRGRDDVVKVQAFPTSPADGDRRAVTVDNSDGLFNEDRGGSDEIYAELEIHPIRPQQDAVRTNKVKGRF